jgi:hypothetical protein
MTMRSIRSGLLLAASLGLSCLPLSAAPTTSHDPARDVVEALYQFRATHGPAQVIDILRLDRLLSAGLISRCTAYVHAPQASDQVPAVNYDALTGAQEVLSPVFPIRLLARGDDWRRYQVLANYPDGSRWGEVDVLAVRLKQGWRVTQVGRLRDDCELGSR